MVKRAILVTISCTLAILGWSNTTRGQTIYGGAGFTFLVPGGSSILRSWKASGASVAVGGESSPTSRFSVAGHFVASWFGEGWTQNEEREKLWRGTKPGLVFMVALPSLRLNTEVGSKTVAPFIEAGGGLIVAYESAYSGTVGRGVFEKEETWPSQMQAGRCIEVGTGVRFNLGWGMRLTLSYQLWFTRMREPDGIDHEASAHSVWLLVSFK